MTVGYAQYLVARVAGGCTAARGVRTARSFISSTVVDIELLSLNWKTAV